jgi:hypothetical protein
MIYQQNQGICLFIPRGATAIGLKPTINLALIGMPLVLNAPSQSFSMDNYV